jgi:uncharacterized repeat protein (TIGR01451 family)
MKSLIKVISRLVPITSLGLMLAAAPPATFAQAQSSPADWTEFHRDNMQRWNPYETVLGVNNVGELKLKWQNAASISLPSPAVVNGVVYVGANDGHVYALNASTGVQLWSSFVGYPVPSSPAVANGMVYFGSGHDASVYALDASTGAKVWSYGTASVVDCWPTVANGVVYVDSEGVNGNVYALDASTGALLWNSATGYFITTHSPAVANGVVYVGTLNGNVHALNASTGVPLWNSAAAGDSIYSSPAVANGAVYFGSYDHNVYALNASTGALLWSYATGDHIFTSSPAVASGVVYIGSEDHNVYALNASTGALLWSYDTGDKVESSPAVANGVVYLGSRGNNGVIALNASTGALLWSYANLNNVADSSPAVVNGTLYVGASAFSLGAGADLFLRIQPTPTTVEQGDLITYAFPVWNLGPEAADHEVLTTQVPAGTTFDSTRISGTPGLGTCTTPPYGGTGEIVCDENGSMAPNTTWTVRLTVKVTAAAGTVITENAATMAGTFDPNLANNMATVSTTVGPVDADLYLRIQPTPTTVHQGDLLTYAFPVWNLGPGNADYEVLNTQVPAGTVFDYVRISGTPGLGTCTTPPYQGTGQIVCRENGSMAPNTTWTVQVTVKVTAPTGTVITENASTSGNNPDPNLANNTASVSLTVQ